MSLASLIVRLPYYILSLSETRKTSVYSRYIGFLFYSACMNVYEDELTIDLTSCISETLQTSCQNVEFILNYM